MTVDRVKARYVKIEIPSGNIDGESATVTEFEVYMDGTSTGLTGTEREVTLLYPNPVKRGAFERGGSGSIEDIYYRRLECMRCSC